LYKINYKIEIMGGLGLLFKGKKREVLLNNPYERETT
jgi:hypothetical protein